MIDSPNWNDEYLLFLMQLYLEHPVGIKPLYSRSLVNLSLDLHIEPQILLKKMQEFVENKDKTPSLKFLWDTYSDDKQKLDEAVCRLRKMRGFGKSDKFYKNVQTVSSFESMFLPIEGYKHISPVMLVMVLNVYPSVLPTAMEEGTPEIVELSKLLGIKPKLVLKIMQTFLMCDPIMNRPKDEDDELYKACLEVWREYANDTPEKLKKQVDELKDYFE